MPFLTYLAARKLPCGRRWQLIESLVYEYAGSRAPDDPGVIITVPVGFVSDLASIPQLFQPLIPVNDAHCAAAVLHDYLYASKEVPRAVADAIFRQAMKDDWVPRWKRVLMWAAVRAFGSWAWRRAATPDA